MFAVESTNNAQKINVLLIISELLERSLMAKIKRIIHLFICFYSQNEQISTPNRS